MTTQDALPSCDPLQVELRHGHSGDVFYLAFSPDGRLLATTGDDVRAKIWDVATGRLLHTMVTGGDDGLDEPHIVFLPDGETLLTENCYEARTWNVRTGELLSTVDLNCSYGPISPDGRLVSGTHPIGVCDAATGDELWSIERGEEEGDPGMAFSGDGTILALRRPTAVEVYDSRSGALLRRFPLPEFAYDSHSIAVSPDGTLVASPTESGNSRDEQLLLWHIPSGEVRWTLPPDTLGADCLTFSPDGVVLSAFDYGRVVQWRVDTGERLPGFAIPEACRLGLIRELRYTPDGSAIAAGTTHTVHLYDLATGKRVRVFGQRRRVVGSVAVSPRGGVAASGDDDGGVRFWSLTTGECLSVLPTGRSIGGLAFSPDGRHLVSSNYGGPAVLWDTATGAQLRTFGREGERASPVAFSPDGTILAVVGERREGREYTGLIRMADVRTGEVKATFEEPGRSISGLRFSPDGALLGVVAYGKVSLRDAATGEVVDRVPDVEWLIDVVFSSDGTLMFTPTMWTRIELWDMRGRRSYLGELDMGVDGITNLAFSPDGRRMVVGHHYIDWLTFADVGPGEYTDRLNGHVGPVNAVAWSPDGRHVLSAGVDGTLKVWDPDDKRLLLTLAVLHADDEEGPGTEWIAFTPDGYFTGSENAECFVQWRVGERLLPYDTHPNRRRPDLVVAALCG
jgi:WD40 repeat protein